MRRTGVGGSWTAPGEDNIETRLGEESLTSKLLAVSFGWVKVMMMMGARMRSQTRWVVERRTAGMMLEWEIIKLRV